MLTEKELMIDDWVMYNPNVFIEDEYEPYQEWYPMKITSGEGIELAIEDCYAPIPLTTDILEKNGFEKNWQDNYEYFDDDENLNITFHPKNSNYTNGAYDYIDIEKGCLTINEMPIAFVHELQHVLKLLGIKKEIEL